MHVEGENKAVKAVQNYKLTYVLYNDGWWLEEIEPYSHKGCNDEMVLKRGVDKKEVSMEIQSVENYSTGNTYELFRECLLEVVPGEIKKVVEEPFYEIYEKVIVYKYPFFSEEIIITSTCSFEDAEWTIQTDGIAVICMNEEELMGEWNTTYEDGDIKVLFGETSEGAFSCTVHRDIPGVLGRNDIVISGVEVDPTFEHGEGVIVFPNESFQTIIKPDGIYCLGNKLWRAGSVEEAQSDKAFAPYLEEYTIYSPKSRDWGSKSDPYINLAVFGANSLDGTLTKYTRSRSITVLSINRYTGQMKVLSVSNKMLLGKATSQGSVGQSEAAYSHGGFGQALGMLNANMDLGISNFITLGYEGIIELVDSVGGIWLYIDENEMEVMNNDFTKVITDEMQLGYIPIERTGYQLLDGIQAATYCLGNLGGQDSEGQSITNVDHLYWTARQQEVFIAILDKIKSIDKVDARGILESLSNSGYIFTSYTVDDLMGIYDWIAQGEIIGAASFPNEEMSEVYKLGPKGTQLTPLDLESNVEWLHEFMYNDENHQVSDQVKSISQEIQELVDKYKR